MTDPSPYEVALPLTPDQAAMLRAGDLRTFIGFRIRGALDAETLRRAVALTVDRHEALRLRLVDRGTKQRFAPPGHGFQDVFASLHGLAAASTYFEECLWRPWDLETEGPFRSFLIQTEAAEYVLVLAIHHLATDAISNGIIAKEVWDRYDELLSAANADPEPPTRCFRDRIVETMGTQAEADDLTPAQESFWSGELAGSSLFTLPPGDGGVGVHEAPQLEIRRSAFADLQSAARSGATTPTALLMAACCNAVARSQSGAPVIEFLHHGRDNLDDLEVVGFFTGRPLYLRCPVVEDGDLGTAAERFVDTWLTAVDYSAPPYTSGRLRAFLRREGLVDWPIDGSAPETRARVIFNVVRSVKRTLQERPVSAPSADLQLEPYSPPPRAQPAGAPAAAPAGGMVVMVTVDSSGEAGGLRADYIQNDEAGAEVRALFDAVSRVLTVGAAP